MHLAGKISLCGKESNLCVKNIFLCGKKLCVEKSDFGKKFDFCVEKSFFCVEKRYFCVEKKLCVETSHSNRKKFFLCGKEIFL